jgi:hypothetical protein
VLIVDADIDVSDADDVADVLGGAVELRLGHGADSFLEARY